MFLGISAGCALLPQTANMQFPVIAVVLHVTCTLGYRHAQASTACPHALSPAAVDWTEECPHAQL